MAQVSRPRRNRRPQVSRSGRLQFERPAVATCAGSETRAQRESPHVRGRRPAHSASQKGTNSCRSPEELGEVSRPRRNRRPQVSRSGRLQFERPAVARRAGSETRAQRETCGRHTCGVGDPRTARLGESSYGSSDRPLPGRRPAHSSVRRNREFWEWRLWRRRGLPNVLDFLFTRIASEQQIDSSHQGPE